MFRTGSVRGAALVPKRQLVPRSRTPRRFARELGAGMCEAFEAAKPEADISWTRNSANGKLWAKRGNEWEKLGQRGITIADRRWNVTRGYGGRNNLGNSSRTPRRWRECGSLRIRRSSWSATVLSVAFHSITPPRSVR